MSPFTVHAIGDLRRSAKETDAIQELSLVPSWVHPLIISHPVLRFLELGPSWSMHTNTALLPWPPQRTPTAWSASS